MKVQNTNDITCQSVKAAIGGMSGSGKTTTLGTLPKEDTLIISGESGTLPIKGTGIDLIDLSKDIVDGKPVVIEDMGKRLEKLSAVYKWAAAGFPDEKGKATWKYKNLAIDSFNELTELVHQKCLKDFPDRKDSFPMWGEYAKITKSIIRRFRDLPMNVFFTILTEYDKDDMGKRYIQPQVSGSIGKSLNQYFDFVFYVHADQEGKRTLHTRSTDKIQLKDRSRKLDAVEEPDLSKIMLKIMED